jgi:hypothetical protein
MEANGRVRKNPWLELRDSPPFVLPDDRSAVEVFNSNPNERTRLELDLLPEPFVGRVDAPILLLLLNPGVSDDDFARHEQPEFRARVRACHRQEQAPYPNYYLDPAVDGPGARWMRRVLSFLIREFGNETVASAIAALEFFPYHSRDFAHRRVSVPSQEHTFDLLRAALRRGAVVFVTRGRAIWAEAVPALRAYPRAFHTHSAQNVVISERNCPEGYDAARSAIKRADKISGRPSRARHAL